MEGKNVPVVGCSSPFFAGIVVASIRMVVVGPMLAVVSRTVASCYRSVSCCRGGADFGICS